MKNRGVVWSLIAAVAFIAVGATFMFIMGVFREEEPVKIGAVLSLSGPGEYIGIETRDGMLMAVRELNTWGGINGRKIQLIIEDSKTHPQAGKEAFNRIEEEHRPLLYASNLSTISMALAPLSEKNSAVLMGLVTADPEFTTGKQWAFRYYPRAKDEVEPILSILHKLKARNVGVLYLDDEYGRSVFEIFSKAFRKSGGNVKSEAFEMKAADFKAKIENLKDMEAIYCVGHTSQLKNIFKQLNVEGFKGVILGSTGASSPNITNMPEAGGVYVVAPLIYDPDFSLAKEKREKYEKKYGKPFTQFSANGYDFIVLLAGLLEADEISRENVKNVLEKDFTYPGVFGIVETKAGEHDISFPLYPAQIMDGRIRYLN